MNTAANVSGPALRTERFAALREDGLADQRLEGWFDAVKFGFHDAKADPVDVARYAESYDLDARVLTAVYDDTVRPGVWDPAVPVATYATMQNTINIGGGVLLPAHLVTAVTVRATHRRRGILRRLITEDLYRAADEGLALAALTASEATIYGRFGFGAAAFGRTVQVDVRERFGLSVPADDAGGVEVADPDLLAALGPEVFARFHARTRGSVGRQSSYAQVVSGRWGQHKPEPDRALRAAVYHGADGAAEGYACYKFAGWDASPRAVKVVDLVAATPAAYLGLWAYLGSIDLVERIEYPLAAVEDPLPWALRDGRGYQVTGEEDTLWLRILDPVTALQSRSYAGAGSVSFEIADPLDLAAGRWRLTAGGGEASVEPLAADAAVDLRLGVEALGSLYLGGTTAHTLAAAGRVAGEPGAVARLDRLMALPERPYCITHF
ncbi:GNAT family N-acetyltransferase [Arthrobacter sp. I2-34]|uniref:GNAT family N-acetyltransferase n=1 Tax=Arthrobacter hankyongi TaxID=2904801 RepID=A0ABS9LC88_9MICC|nr:GNAT family N-acetyltransferase [Arthrobacter hankyongi]MCG2624294.1 GNAT family N-acetyltransferase [Arthrobacter hankyongi]